MGEICVQSLGLAVPGYLNDEVKTSESFVSWPYPGGQPSWNNRIFRTGDLGIVLAPPPSRLTATAATASAGAVECGQLLVLGRAGSTFKIRGFKVGVPMVEAALAQPGPGGSPVAVALCAYVEPVDSFDLPVRIDELLHHVKASLRASLPSYAVPTHYVLMREGLPRM
ncbi:hypothetical protein T492DRAFT_872498 [Pavlovales sp. CCMP2436]|nr:hypothetical protein T492DRAFT_872498 [Pavlovales sp. CCMP2436]